MKTENDCPFCAMDDTDIPSMEEAVKAIVYHRDMFSYNERMHKLNFKKGGGLKFDSDPIE